VIERTLAIIKPDGVKKNLIGEVIRRYESKGFRIIGMKLVQMTQYAKYFNGNLLYQ